MKEMNPKKDKVADIQTTMDEVVLERKYSKVEHRRSLEAGEASTGSNADVSGAKSSMEGSPVVVVVDDKGALGNKVRFSDNSVEVR